MEVVPTATLPLLALPSGATQKRRKRHNDLDEREEELLRIQIRQHFGSAALNTKATRGDRERRRQSSLATHETTSLTGNSSSSTGDGFDLSTLGEMLTAPHKHVRLTDAFKLAKRLLWVSDEDMNEEISENDPKIVAGKQFLKGVEAFSMLSENELAQLAGLSELLTFKAGDVVLGDEREADGLYIVLSGTASRYNLTSADPSASQPTYKEPSTNDDGTSENFGYQDHFGTIISPTEAAQTERDEETAVVATSESLECFWIPELVVRMLNVQPRMEYEFALVLHNHRFQKDAQYHEQEALVAHLLRAGIHVAVLANTRNTCNYIVLLLSAPLSLLAREDKLMTMERIVEHQSAEDATLLTDDDLSHAETMGASDRIAAFASILTRPPTDKPPGVGLRGIENNVDLIVKDIFPLHDPSMTDFILSTWFKETHSASTKRLFLLRIKDYFGLRVAFFTAFERLYNSALIYPLNAGALLWIVWRWAHYRSYVKALGIYGLCVAFVWAPSFIKRWLRYQNSLLVEWNLLGATEVALPNPQFNDYVVETINVAAPDEPPDYVEVKTYDHRRRWPKYAIFALFCFFCLVLLFIFVGIYVQWYIVAVMTPMCTNPRCPEFLDNPGGCEAHCHELFAQGKKYLFMQSIESCATYCDTKTFDRSYYQCDAALIGCFATEGGVLGTARWFYILVQGIVLGLTLDIVFLALFEAIASTFNAWENYATEQEKETRFIEKIFLFNWVGYFYWFMLLAFCYVPNGDKVQAYIRENMDQSWVFTLNRNVRFSRYWVDGLISMDSAFVTPMIVTQALNLVINTFVPFLLRRAIVRARDSYHVKKERISTAIQQRSKRRHQPARPTQPHGRNNLEASTLSASVMAEASTTSELNVLLDGDAAWLALSDLPTLDRHEVATMLAQREPIKAEQLDASIHSLFASLTSHDSHMAKICGGITRDELDSYQATSYEWLDRVTRNMEASGQLKGLVIQDASSTTRSTSPDLELPLQFITQWPCRQYLYTADRILEESSMPIYSPFGDLLHLAIQFSYTIMFSVVWPFICLCSFARNYVALRFDAIKMAIDCKRPIPRRTIGIGRAWLGAFLFEILAAQIVVPGLFVYVSGQLDAFDGDCIISEIRYGPAINADACGLDAGGRLKAYVALENVGIALMFLIYLKKSDISHETSIKIVEHSRKLKHHVRKSVRMIGETILVAVVPSTRPTTKKTNADKPPPNQQEQRKSDLMSFPEPASADPNALFAVDLLDNSSPAAKPLPLHRRRTQALLEMVSSKAVLDAAAIPTSDDGVEWREGVVAWVKNGRVRVNFSGGRQLSTGGGNSRSSGSSQEVWLASHERYTLREPSPVRIFELGMPVLLASKKFGVWTEATVVALDHRDRFGHELRHTANEMHVRFVEAQNLRTSVVRQAVLMDPYCVLTVSGAPHIKATTSVKRSTLNPVWDEHVVLPLLETELYSSAAGGTASTDASAPSAQPSTQPSAASSRSHSLVGMAPTLSTTTAATLTAAAVAVRQPRRTVTVSVLNNDAFAAGECVGQVEIDLHQFRSGQKYRILVPLGQPTRRHVWTLDAIHSVMRKQARGAVEYPMLGLPHVLLELQWIDTRLPTKVTVRGTVQGQKLVLSRKFCQTNLCYGIDPDRVVQGTMP